MGGEAALAYQIASGLIGAGGAYANANSRAASNEFMPDRSGLDASIASYQKSLDIEYGATNKQADLILQELGTEATRQAQESEYEQNTTAQAFNSSGVTLAGTPLAIISKQRQLKLQEIDALRNRATALADLERAKGTIAYNEGNAKIGAIQGDYITKAAQYAITSASTKSAAQSYASEDFMNLLGSTFGLLGNTTFGQKLTSQFRRTPTGNRARTYSPSQSLFGPQSFVGLP